MIKLLLITLLCVAVFATSSADSPDDEMNQGWMEPAKAVADMAEYAMAGQGRSLVRRAAQHDGKSGPPPNEPPPNVQSSSQLGFRSLVRRATDDEVHEERGGQQKPQGRRQGPQGGQPGPQN